MATYNGEAFLQKQLASIARQTRLPDELIISDDSSSDATVEIAEAFAQAAPFPVKLFVAQKTTGYAKNFISATKHSNAELIFFADQDDIWREDKIAVLSAIVAESSELVISHDMSIFSDDPARMSYPSYYRFLRSEGLSPAVCLKGCTMAIKTAFFTEWGWPTEGSTVSHDFWVALLATAFRQRKYVEDILIEHRLHDANTSGWIASRQDLVRFSPGDSTREAVPTDLDLLIDLCIKEWNLDWTDLFLDVVKQHGYRQNQELQSAFKASLQKNLDWYAERKSVIRSFSPQHLWTEKKRIGKKIVDRLLATRPASRK